MYSSSGGVANGGRIYNPRPDPAEVGPPRRVNREESHVGEMVASSKRRISWTFTLGDSENIHEVVLVHSILSYKKVIEFDGRQMHFSSTATPGDWSYTMFLDNTKYAIEVRINDLDSADVPKYDLVIDRVPFRRWDVFRRRKQVNAPAGSVFGRSSFQQQAPTQTGGGDTFGKHKWGPSGMTAPAPMEPSPPSYGQRNSGSFSRDDVPNRQRSSGSFSRDDVPNTQRNSGSFSRSDVPNVTYQSPSSSQGLYNGGTSQPSQAHYNGAASQRQPSQMKTTQAASTQRRKSIHDEIDLLGDFGSSDSTTVTAQQLIFDPLAGSKLGAGQQSARTASQPSMPAVTPPHPNARTASNPQLAQQQPAQPYVDPFATVAQPLPIKPGASSFNLDPLATQNSMYMQQQNMQQQSRPATMGMPSYPTYQPQGGIPRGMPMQQQPMQGGYPTSVSGMPAANGGYQPPKIGGGNSGGANYNISHLMNPMEVNSLRNAQQTKSINIDPFAGMHTK